MSRSIVKQIFTDPANLFCIGLAGVMLSLTIAIPPVWVTFIHPWRVELFASVFLLLVIVVSFRRNKDARRGLTIGEKEFRYILAPMLAFTLWSGISALWSTSPRSAAHHTLVWCLYLVFYISVRQLFQRAGSYSKLISAFSMPLLFFAILAIAGYLTVVFFGNAPLGIIYSKYGEQINTFFPLLLLGMLKKTGKAFFVGAAALVVLWLLIFSSSSRTGLGLFAISLALIGVSVFSLKRLHGFRLKFAMVAALIVITPLGLTALSFASADAVIPTVGRFADKTHLAGSDDFRKLMIKLSVDMFAENPVLGIGADNFGFRANEFRERYAKKNPDDVVLVQAENSIPERAHNEYLQIAAELGLVGVIIFAYFLFGIARLGVFALSNYRKVPLHAFAAMIGIGVFLASSLVTSYSFRLIQNGFVFFFVLAVLVRATSKLESERTEKEVSSSVCRAGYAVALLACLSLAALSGIRVAGVAATTRANSTADLNDATSLYKNAARLDPEDPLPHYYLGLRLIEAGEYGKAAPLLKESIRIGKAPSCDYSYLATAQSLAGDNAAAEQTFADAAVMYPRSTFVLARYAALLKSNNKNAESELQMQRARLINEREANGWLAFITKGSKFASDLAFQRPDKQTKVMDLLPSECIYAVLAERDIRYPDERERFPWEKIQKAEGGR